MALEQRFELTDYSPMVLAWRQMLVDVGGLSETEFAAFLSGQRAFAARDRLGWLQHETAGYEAAYALVPKDLRAKYSSGELVPLKNEIHRILDRYFHRHDFDPALIAEVRGAVAAAVANWTTAQSAP
jgi:hypothetical protein